MPQRIIDGGTDAVRRISRLSLRALGLFARVRPDERRDVAGAFLTLLGFMAGHALLETARDALFLARLPARQLPWVYLAIALAALAIGQREPRVVRHMSGRTELGRWLAAASAVTFGFWLLVGRPWPWVFHALYVWSGLMASLVVVRFWTVLSSRFTFTQAKRIYPVIASGSVAGAILGAAAARALTEAVSAQHLVLAAAAAFFAAGWAPTLMGDADPAVVPGRGEDLSRAFPQIWSSPYLRRVAIAVLLATVTFTLVDYTFKSATDRLVAPEDLGEFFASVYLTLNILSLVVQLLGVAWLVRSLGVVSSVAMVPAAFLLATLGFTVTGGLAMVLVLKGVDGTLRHSLYRTGTELLFVPLSQRLRAEVKGVIDVLGQRGGQALASILILMVLSTTGREPVFAVMASLTAVAWLVVILSLREPYLDVFRAALRPEGRASLVRSEFPALDVASLETLLATLNSPDERRVVAALTVLEEQGKAGVVPSLLLYHPAQAVVVRSLEVFGAAGREDALPLAERLLAHRDWSVRAAALRMVATLNPQRELVDTVLEDPRAELRVTAHVVRLALGWGEPDAERAAIAGELSRGGVSVRVAAARAIRCQPYAPVEPFLVELLDAEDEAVVREAIAAAQQSRSPGLVGPLIRLLSRRAVRDEVVTALAAFGPLALARLGEALADPSLPHSVRRHVPSALALTGSTQAPDILLRHLLGEQDGMIRFKILRSLGRWRGERREVPLDPDVVGEALRQALTNGFRLMAWRRDLERGTQADETRRTELHEVLVALLRDKGDHTLERVLRLIDLQSGDQEFKRLYRGLHSPRSATRAGSRELLSNLVVPAVRRPLMMLVDDLHGGEEPSAGWSSPPDRAEYAEALEELVSCGMESVSSLAALHAAELGLTELLEPIQGCSPLSEEHGASLARAADELRRRAA